MIDLPAQILESLATKSAIRMFVGQFIARDGVRAIVDVGGGRIPVEVATSYVPAVNEDVRVWFVDGSPFMVAPAGLKAVSGVVMSVAGDFVVVDTDDGEKRMTFPEQLRAVLASGQMVRYQPDEGGSVLSILSTTPEPPAPPPPPVSSIREQERTDVFTALDAGSYRGRWWQAEIWGSDTNTGAAFFGSKINGTIPDTSPIRSVEVFISPNMISGNNPLFFVHSSPSKPGGNVTPILSQVLAPTPGWMALPVGWGDTLKSQNTGVGVGSGGYHKFKSLQQDPLSFALRIRSRY